MPTLSFSAILSTNMDHEMEDVSPTSPEPPTIEIPLNFDFDFELEEFKPDRSTNSSSDSCSSDGEPRSPRTPTYAGGSQGSSASSSPFDPDRFFRFPILTDSSESSPLRALSCSAAAHSHFDLHRVHSDSIGHQNEDFPSPPASPLLWIWTCHLCRSKYPLGATRRCLIDGHFYCSGDSGATAQKNVKRKKRGQSCSSEFDYVGWQEWSSWRKQDIGAKKRNAIGGELKKGASCLRGCESCEYPSQCRYERLNKVPEVVMALSSRTVEREVEVQAVSIKSSEVRSKETRGKKKTLKVKTGLVRSGSHRRRIDVPDNTEQTDTSGEISPDLVNFASLMEPTVQDLVPKTDGNIDTTRDGEAQHTADTESSASKSSKAKYKENTKKKRSSEQCSTTQSRISDFFGITR